MAYIYFNTSTKTVIDLENSLESRLVKGFVGWLNLLIMNKLMLSSYDELPDKLKNSKMGLIDIKTDENKWYHWSHIRNLNPLKVHPENKQNWTGKCLMVLVRVTISCL